MKFISGFIGFLIAIIALCFALSNRQVTTISLWPLDTEVQAPLYLLSLGTLFVGLVFGAVVAWLSMIPHRLRTLRLHKDITALNDKIMDLQQTVLAPNRADENFNAPTKMRWRFLGTEIMTASTIFCAIDTPDLAKAQALAAQLQGKVYGLKLGLEFYMAHGPGGFRAIASKTTLPLFLDVKLHDIPNTVAGALASLLPLKPAFVTIHTSGGSAMMRVAADTAAKIGAARPKLLGVTVLTSLDNKDLSAVGQENDSKQQVMRLARLAKDSGLDGVICSPEEVAVLRRNFGPDFILMVPGIRPSWAAAGDQKRVMTPKEAVAAGATYLVIGRPITGADNPADAAERITSELT